MTKVAHLMQIGARESESIRTCRVCGEQKAFPSEFPSVGKSEAGKWYFSWRCRTCKAAYLRRYMHQSAPRDTPLGLLGPQTKAGLASYARRIGGKNAILRFGRLQEEALKRQKLWYDTEKAWEALIEKEARRLQRSGSAKRSRS